ncbi:MAG: GNAT family N-acetyltransferase [Myxococcaceae bacterium]|nr:GNAT family N-acetyltransferase [Myxococcaceae bacterium]
MRGRVWHTRAMSAVTIREATSADDEAIGELLVQAFVEQYARKMPEVQVTERRTRELRDVASKRAIAKVWVAEDGGQVVGTVAVWPVGADGSEAWLPEACDLRHLAVAASARGQSVSSRLLDAAEGWVRQSGATRVVLHVRRGAKGVRALYEARGYVRDEAGDIDALPEVFLEAFQLPL